MSALYVGIDLGIHGLKHNDPENQHDRVAHRVIEALMKEFKLSYDDIDAEVTEWAGEEEHDLSLEGNHD